MLEKNNPGKKDFMIFCEGERKTSLKKHIWEKTDYGKTDFGKRYFGKTDFEKPNFGKKAVGKTDFGKTDFAKTNFGKPDFENLSVHVPIHRKGTVDAIGWDKEWGE